MLAERLAFLVKIIPTGDILSLIFAEEKIKRYLWRIIFKLFTNEKLYNDDPRKHHEPVCDEGDYAAV